MTLADLGVGFLQSWINFGVVSIASAQVALLVTYVRLPLIIGYMFFGLMAGPQVCDLVTAEDIPHLLYITQFALSFICLSAGAELYLPELKSLFRRILTLTGLITVITFVLVVVIVYLESVGGLASYTSQLPSVGLGSCEFSIALIAAAIMVSQSPASAIAVVREVRAKGPFTSTMLGVTVLIDVVVLLLSSIAISVSSSECDPNSSGFAVIDLLLTLGTILLAVFLGWLFGKIIIFCIWLPRVPGEWAVPFLGFAVFQFSTWFFVWTREVWNHAVNLDALLICITAGYVVANQSRNRRKFLRFFNRAGPIIFIPFFTLTGAGLQLGVLSSALPFAVITALARAAAFACASLVGGYWTGMPRKHREWLWVAMITQAGVSLGIAAEVAINFPSWGGAFQSVIVAVIIINQIVGPVLCAFVLNRVGEAEQADEDEDEDGRVRRALLFGMNDDSYALAQRLLNANWNVVFLDTDAEKLKLASFLTVPVRRRRSVAAIDVPDTQAAAGAGDKAAEEVKDADGSMRTVTTRTASPSQAASSSSPSLSELTSETRAEAAAGTEGDGGGDGEARAEPDVDSRTAPSLATMPDDEDAAPESSTTRALPNAGRSDSTYAALETTEEAVTTLLVTPLTSRPTSASVRFALTESGSARARDNRHESLLLGYEAQLEGIRPGNADTAVVFLTSDSQAFALCNLLLEQFHLTKVISQVNNPNWASMFASIGCLPIYSFSATVAMLFQACISTKGQMEMINPRRPTHTQLAELIRPDTTPSVPIHLLYSTLQDQQDFLKAHPNPPLSEDRLFKFNEKFRVVPDAVREEYVTSIYGVHASRSGINTGRNLARAGLTFSGPMMAGNGWQAVDQLSDDDDDDDAKAGEIQLQEMERELDEVDWAAGEEGEEEKREEMETGGSSSSSGSRHVKQR